MNQQTSFQIKTDAFEGPFDLLLTLIEKRKLHVSDVSLAQVADDYILYVNEQENFPVDETANFIVVAATLLLIKSRNLLPVLELTQEEESDIVDLEKRLRLYKKIRRISMLLTPQWAKNVLIARQYVPEPDPVFAPAEDLTIENLHSALQSMLRHAKVHAKPIPKARVQKVISLEEMMDRLATRIQKSLTMSFKDFSQMGKTEKVNVVISFLAMLELVKQGAINVVQQGAFQDIELSATNVVSAPKYD